MTKNQLITNLSAKTGATKTDAGKFLEGFTAVVTEALKAEGEVTLPGLVKLVVKDTPAKPAGVARNPFTKQMVDVPAKPASKRVKAKPLGPLKKAVA